MTSTEYRFWGKVWFGDGCWEWTATKHRQGYGWFNLDGRMTLAHRVAWTFENGPIPTGLCVCHKCDNTGCVRPGHLFLGTYADNIADRHGKGRSRGGSRPGCGAKITESDIAGIKSMLAGGSLQREVAKAFGISQSSVSNIVRGKTWRHVKEEQ